MRPRLSVGWEMKICISFPGESGACGHFEEYCVAEFGKTFIFVCLLLEDFVYFPSSVVTWGYSLYVHMKSKQTSFQERGWLGNGDGSHHGPELERMMLV